MTTVKPRPEQLVVGRLHFAVLERAERRTLEITVERDASLTIKTPTGVTRAQIEPFVATKQDWIYRKLAEKDAVNTTPVVKTFITGEGFAYLGRNYRLQIIGGQDIPVKLERGRLRMTKTAAASGHIAMREWYGTTGAPWLQRRIQPWAERNGITHIEIHVTDLGYRWGSTRGNDKINVHWAALQLRPSLIDYILVHELAHLNEANHTPEFWRHVERLQPDYEQRRTTLANAGQTVWLGS